MISDLYESRHATTRIKDRKKVIFCFASLKNQFHQLYSTKLGTLRSDDGDGNGNAIKAIGLITKTTILHVHHAFLYISCHNFTTTT